MTATAQRRDLRRTGECKVWSHGFTQHANTSQEYWLHFTFETRCCQHHRLGLDCSRENLPVLLPV